MKTKYWYHFVFVRLTALGIAVVLFLPFAGGQDTLFYESFEENSSPNNFLGTDDMQKTISDWYSVNVCTPDIICNNNADVVLSECRVLQSKSGHSSLGLVFNKNNEPRTDKPDRLWSELVQRKLPRKLKKGKNYYVEFWVSSNCGYKVLDGFGIHFSNSVFKDSLSTGYLKTKPHIWSPCRLTKNWKKVSKLFRPDEDYEYLTVGYIDHSTLGICDYYFVIDDILIKEVDAGFESHRSVEDYCFESGQQIPLNNIEFEVNKSSLKEHSFSELSMLAQILKKDPTLYIRVEGYTDNQGGAGENIILSENRAKTVFDYLQAEGVSQERMSRKGFGEAKPIASNETAAGRQRNRRVVINVVERKSPNEAYLKACKYAGKGDRDSAFYYLKMSISLGVDDPIILFDYDLQSLKKDPRWKEISGYVKNHYIVHNSTIAMKEKLAYQLKLILLEDQVIRDNSCRNFRYLKGEDYPCDSARIDADFMANSMTLNRKHRKQIDRYFGGKELPYRHRIGTTGYDAIFCVVQHSGDAGYMKKYLRKFEKNAKTDDVLLSYIAFMKDRLRVLEDRPQLYGTQYSGSPGGKLYPIENPEKLNERRKSMGLQPLPDYEKK